MRYIDRYTRLNIIIKNWPYDLCTIDSWQIYVKSNWRKLSQRAARREIAKLARSLDSYRYVTSIFRIST